MSISADSNFGDFKPNGGCSTPDIADQMAKQTIETIKKAADEAKAIKNAMKKKPDEFVKEDKVDKKTNYTAKGAKIGFGMDIASKVLGVGALVGLFGKKAVAESFKGLVEGLGKSKVAMMLAGGIAVSTAIGAGIGKLVGNHKAKKEAQNNKNAQ